MPAGDPLCFPSQFPSSFEIDTSKLATFTFAPPPPTNFVFSAEGKELAHIKPDGTVVVSHKGAEPEAADAFWGAVQLRGQNLIARVKELEERLGKYETVEKTII